jgi:fluoroquinolone resistance protein
MEKRYHEAETFEKIDYAQGSFPKGDYEDCTFTNCNFTNTDLSGTTFINCEFIGCNLSMAAIRKTGFQDIDFKNCKLLGLRFDEANPFLFTIRCEGCILNFTSFYKLKVCHSVFRNCSLQDVDFTESDLTGLVFNQCDLLRAKFDNTILDKADLRTAYNYSIDPAGNRIKKAKFSTSGLIGLLDRYDIIIE